MVLFISAFIFYMSAKTAGESNEISGSLLERVLSLFIKDFWSLDDSAREVIIASYHVLIRKTAHFSIFAALGFSAAGFFASFDRIKQMQIPLFATAYTFLYAVSDELHQLFVVGRSGQLTDVLLDTAGGIFGTLIFILILKLYYRRLKGYEAK